MLSVNDGLIILNNLFLPWNGTISISPFFISSGLNFGSQSLAPGSSPHTKMVPEELYSK
mgnify:CR=1 FL=1